MAWACIDMIAGGRYRVESVLGSGSFGDIFKGRDLKTNELVAIKMEAIGAKHPQLRYEAKLYYKFSGTFGVPSFHWFGKEGRWNVLVLELLGASLQDLIETRGGTFSVKTVLMLAEQMIDRLEWLHSQNFLHRDIKPDNFVMGAGGKANVVHMIDFGFAKKFRENNLDHIPYKEGKRLIGTIRYASLNTHLGIESARRDDLESLGYVLMFFLRGSLPWQSVTSTDGKVWNDAIMKSKMRNSTELLCAGFPCEFAEYLDACKALNFQDDPDYSRLKTILRKAFDREQYVRDFVFDWTSTIPSDIAEDCEKKAVSESRASNLSARSESAEKDSTCTPSSFCARTDPSSLNESGV